MTNPSEKKYHLVRGSEPRVIHGLEAKRLVQRELHGIIVKTPIPRQGKAYMTDLRRGRRQAWGPLLKFIDVAIMQGVSKKTLMQIPELLYWYLEDRFADRAQVSNDQPRRAA